MQNVLKTLLFAIHKLFTMGNRVWLDNAIHAIEERCSSDGFPQDANMRFKCGGTATICDAVPSGCDVDVLLLGCVDAKYSPKHHNSVVALRPNSPLSPPLRETTTNKTQTTNVYAAQFGMCDAAFETMRPPAANHLPQTQSSVSPAQTIAPKTLAIYVNYIYIYICIYAPHR